MSAPDRAEREGRRLHLADEARAGPLAGRPKVDAAAPFQVARWLQRTLGNQAVQRFLRNRGEIGGKAIRFDQTPRGRYEIKSKDAVEGDTQYGLDFLEAVIPPTITSGVPPSVSSSRAEPPKPPGAMKQPEKKETAMERLKRQGKGGRPASLPSSEKKASALADASPADKPEFKAALQIVRGSNPNYGMEGDREAETDYQAHVATKAREKLVEEQQAAVRRKHEEKANALNPERLLESKVLYDYAHWFNYLWKELKNADPGERVEIAAQAPDAATKQDAAILERMYGLGFVEVADVAPRANVREEPQEASKGYPKVLPSLVESGLVYRSDSRPPLDIAKTSGSTSRFKRAETEPALVTEMNLDQSWNPFKSTARRRMLLLRLGSADNDLNSTVSVAVDPRDTVRFPLPGEVKAGGQRVSGGTDTTHLYVCVVDKVLDTTGVLREKNVASFGRGELGVRQIDYGSHLLHAEVERFFHDQSVGYVVGRITKVELLHPPDEYIKNLAPATRRALNQVYSQLQGGSLTWLVSGIPEKPQQFTPDESKVRHIDVKGRDVDRFKVAADKLVQNNWYTDEKTPRLRYQFLGAIPGADVYQFRETDTATAEATVRAAVGGAIASRHAEIAAAMLEQKSTTPGPHLDMWLRGRQVKDEFLREPDEMIVTGQYEGDYRRKYTYLGWSVRQSHFLPRAIRLHFGEKLYDTLSDKEKEPALRNTKHESENDGAIYTYLHPGNLDPDLGASYVFEFAEHNFVRVKP